MSTIDDIWCYLAALESEIDALAPGSLDYTTASELFACIDALAIRVEELFVCAAPDYPEEAEDND